MGFKVHNIIIFIKKTILFNFKILILYYRYEPSMEEERKHIADMKLRHSLKMFNLFELMTMNITVQQVKNR